MITTHETIHVTGTVIYCDKCKARGPQAAYENVEDVCDTAEHEGWQLAGMGEGKDADKDLCPKCAPPKAPPAPYVDPKASIKIPRKKAK